MLMKKEATNVIILNLPMGLYGRGGRLYLLSAFIFIFY